MKSLLLILLLHLSLFAMSSITKVKFESGVSFYGKIGETQLIFKEDTQHNTYKMKVIATSTGILKALSNDRVDTFLSEGIIKDGIYIPTKYTKKAVEIGYEKLTIYEFDYKTNSINKEVVKKKNVTTTQFDHSKFMFVEKDEIVETKTTKKLKMYTNDFLTLYLNFKYHNLKNGNITYLDQKEGDFVSILDEKTFQINKDKGENKIKITLVDDEKSIFFQEATSELSFYGDAYIKKISEKTNIEN